MRSFMHCLESFLVSYTHYTLKALVETGKLGDCFFFSRAGWNGMRASSTVAWAGDQNVDFSYGDGLFTTIPAALR